MLSVAPLSVSPVKSEKNKMFSFTPVRYSKIKRDKKRGKWKYSDDPKANPLKTRNILRPTFFEVLNLTNEKKRP